jgi:hypothetical protein
VANGGFMVGKAYRKRTKIRNSILASAPTLRTYP